MRCDKGSNMCPRQTTPPTNNMSRMNDNSWNKVVAGVVTCNLTASGGAAITTCKTSVIAALPQQWLACQLFCSRVFFLGLESRLGFCLTLVVGLWPNSFSRTGSIRPFLLQSTLKSHTALRKNFDVRIKCVSNLQQNKPRNTKIGDSCW
jgi:hypothetical protein